ncbi:MAG: acyl carrier protein [Planctomycetaceae bacterium]|nr:acyl carrier protein [Planctomycetaceae bacterium]
MAMTRDEIFKQIQVVLVDALGVDEEEVTPEAKLMGDLGAESIDFLDIVFRMEKAFSLKIPREELFPAENIITNKDYVSNGKLTHLGIEELRKSMPHTDFTDFVDDPSISKIGDLFTVDVLVNFVEGKLK